MKRVEAVLFRPIVRRTAAAATAAAVVLAVGGPTFLYFELRRAVGLRAASSATRMAELTRSVVAELPDLWYYATPKLARHLHFLAADPAVDRVALIDSEGRRVDVPGAEAGEPGWPPIWWARAPIYRGDEVVASVWVGVDASTPLAQVGLLALLSLALAAGLSTVLYVLPVRIADRAQGRIESLLASLEVARTDLAALNQDLEVRVEERSKELADAVEALRVSEERLRDMAARAAEATEQERQRVARELHDGAGQVLTAIRLSLQVLGAAETRSVTKERLADAEGLVDEAIDEVRRIAMALGPAALHRLGLAQSLEELTRSLASRSGLPIEFSAPERLDGLSAAVESAAYRVVQEGLTNVLRHAEAARVGVEVELDGGRLEIAVSDDGLGFDPAAPRSGLGLAGMQERVALLGGTLSVESAPGRGCRLHASLPLPREAPPRAAARETDDD